MKKWSIVFFIALSLLCLREWYAYTDEQREATKFIASKGIIQEHVTDITKYNLDGNITRREMLKVMMKLSEKSITDSCSGEFSDMNASDWGCKYAEAALQEWYIAANSTFRPDDNVTQIEALKMIMQAKWIARDEVEDWRQWYITKAQSVWITKEMYIDPDKNALRAWIFLGAANSYSNFSYLPQVQENLEIPLDLRELFQSIGVE